MFASDSTTLISMWIKETCQIRRSLSRGSVPWKLEKVRLRKELGRGDTERGKWGKKRGARGGNWRTSPRQLILLVLSQSLCTSSHPTTHRRHHHYRCNHYYYHHQVPAGRSGPYNCHSGLYNWLGIVLSLRRTACLSLALWLSQERRVLRSPAVNSSNLILTCR